MINFTWKFNLQKTIPYDINTSNTDVIKTLGWFIIGTDSEYPNKTLGTSGCIDFDISTLSDFTPINEITDADLQAWVENRVGIERINTMKTNLETQISSLPNDWNPTPDA